jgi:tetratricopeptide (TPR) repeat protein
LKGKVSRAKGSFNEFSAPWRARMLFHLGARDLAIRVLSMEKTALNRILKAAIHRWGGLILLMIAVGGCSSLGFSPPGSQPYQERESTPESTEIDPLQVAYANFMRANLYAHEERYEEARSLLQQAIDHDPDSPFLYRKMAEVLMALKSYDEATLYAQNAVERAPGDIEGRLLLAEIYTLGGNDDAAILEYEEVLKIDPQQKRVALVLISVLIKQKQFQSALHHLDKLIEDDPSLVIAYYYRGRIFLELGRYDEAEEAYKAAIQLNEVMEPALFDLGSLYQMKKADEKAAEIYEKLLEFHPNNALVRERLIGLYYQMGKRAEAERHMEEIKRGSAPGDPRRQSLGLIYLQQGMLDESIEELELILSGWPEDDKTRFYLATAYEEKGETDKSLEQFRAINQGSSYYTMAQIHIAYILNIQGKSDEAIEIVQRAIEGDPERLELYLLLASFYETRQDYDRAMATLEAGLSRVGEDGELLFRMGVILDKTGQKEESIAKMRKVIELEPNHADALNYIGYTFAEQGIKLDEAETLIKKALSLKPDSGYIVDSLGWVYYQKGFYAKALKTLQRAVTLTPNDPAIMDHLGDAFFKTGAYEKALQAYEKALALEFPKEEQIKKKIEEVKKYLE